MATKLEKELKEVIGSLEKALEVVNKKLLDSQETTRETYAECTEITKNLKFMTEERDVCLSDIKDLRGEVSFLKNSLTSSTKSVNELEVKCSKQSEIIKSLSESINLMVSMESSHGR